MAESYLTLLQTGAQVTSDAFSRIDNAMKTSYLAQEEARMFDSKMAARATEFAADMSFKNAQLDEQKRQNAVAAENMAFDNEMRWRQFEQNAELMPLQKQAALINLESARLNKARQIEQYRSQKMNEVLAPFNAQAAGILAGNLNEQFGNDYLTLQAEALDEITRTGRLDINNFKYRFDNLKDAYGTTPPEDAKYNPGVAVMMDKFGASAEAARYRAMNPTYAGATTSIISGMVLGSDAQYNDLGLKTGGMFSKEEQANIAMSRNARIGVDTKIESTQRQLQQNATMWSSASKDPASRVRLEDERKSLEEELIKLNKERSSIMEQALGVKSSFTNPQAEESPTEKAMRDARILREKANQEAEEIKKKGQGVYGEPIQTSSLDKNADAVAKQSSLGSYLVNFPEAFGTPEEPKINFNSWNGQNPRSGDNQGHFVNSLRSRIIDNISNLPLDDKEAREDGIEGSQTLEGLLKSPKFAETLSKLNGVVLKEMHPTAMNKTEGKKADWIIGKQTQFEPINKFIKWAQRPNPNRPDTGVGNIADLEDVMSEIKNFDGSREEKRQLIEMLYSTIVATGAVEAFSY